jgi:hypothetical protein
MKYLYTLAVFLLFATFASAKENQWELGAGYRTTQAMEVHVGYGGDFAKAVFYAVDDFKGKNSGDVFGGLRLRGIKREAHEVYVNVLYGTPGFRFDAGLERWAYSKEGWDIYWDFKYSYYSVGRHHMYAGVVVR